MLKNLKITLIIISILTQVISLAKSDERKILPIQKPLLTDIELKKKILINILKPLPKPKLYSEQSIIEKKEVKKTKFLLPKKKTINSRI